MNNWHALILGLVEGLTEFLPISSTAHLILFSQWLKIPSSEFLKTFEISIQLGAILAVVILYWKKIWSSWNIIFKIGTAFITTSIIGLALYETAKNYLMENNYLIGGTLFFGGIIIILFEKYYCKNKNTSPTVLVKDDKPLEAMTYAQATIIGACQALAIVPGVSRSAATIIGGLSLGLSRTNIVEFSFLLAIPTMMAATSLDLYKSRETLSLLGSGDFTAWTVGFTVSFVTAIIGVKFFLKFIQKNNFAPFGWYRIVLGIIILSYLLL